MKRFLLFAGENYYPGGGWCDFIGSFDTIYAAKPHAKGYDWWHVIDTKTGEEVCNESMRCVNGGYPLES